MKLKFFRRKPAGATSEPTTAALSVAGQVQHELYPVVKRLHDQMDSAQSLIRDISSFTTHYQWNSIAKDINDRLDTGILGAIKLWVNEATERGRHDRQMFDHLMKRWEDDRNGLLAIIEDHKQAILKLETQIRGHLEASQ